MKIRSRLYSSSMTNPITVSLYTRCLQSPREAGPRFPVAESVLMDAVLQPYVHDCLVLIREGRQTHRFRVFFKRHTRLRHNPSLSRSLRQSERTGEFLVMRASALKLMSVVNMRGGDLMLADWMISRWVQPENSPTHLLICISFVFYRFVRKVRGIKRGPLPRTVTFVKDINSRCLRSSI